MKIIIAAVTVFGAYLAFSDALTCYSCTSTIEISSCANGTSMITVNCTAQGLRNCGVYEWTDGSSYYVEKGCAYNNSDFCKNKEPNPNGLYTCTTCGIDGCNKKEKEHNDGNSASFLRMSFVLLMISSAMSMMWSK